MAEASREDREILAKARIAALKTSLALTASQEPHWATVETTLHDVAKERLASREQLRQTRAGRRGQAPDVGAILHDAASRYRARAGQIEKFADAAGPLLGSLDEGQKRRFIMVLRKAARSRSIGSPWQGMISFVRRSAAARKA